MTNEDHDICGYCHGGIHLEAGDLGFGEVTVWEHDTWLGYSGGYDHDPTPFETVERLRREAKPSSINPTTERGISK